MAKRSFRIALAIVLGSFLVLGGVGWWVVSSVLDYPDEAHGGTPDDIVVEIEPGMSFPQIAERLADDGVISRPRWFRLFAMNEGVTTKVRPGRYVLQGNMTPRAVLKKLLEGVKEVTVSVTVAEGLNMLEVFAEVEKKRVAKAAELEALARDAEFLARSGIEGETVEGYLFPETYDFAVPTPPAKVLETMIKQHRVVWDRIRREKSKPIERLKEKLRWSDRDVLIMASIVEKEAVVAAERPRIAQVFMNRLTDDDFTPHRLDTDPTIRYGCTVPPRKSAGCLQWDKKDRLRRAQLDDTDNPYNTYRHEGLPPGPICNPGEASLRATIEPDGSRYYYFVAKEDKRHHAFARTKDEHDRNVDKYQK